eukprot:scaffold1141_cov128-Isochrysis_galbana.AAC.4
MEVEPADARPASLASGPADTAPTDTDMSAQKRPCDPASGNMVSSSPVQNAPKCSSDACEPVCDDRLSVRPRLPRLPPSGLWMSILVSKWRYLVGLAICPRGPRARGLPIA